jgi:hypothetical protein
MLLNQSFVPILFRIQPKYRIGGVYRVTEMDRSTTREWFYGICLCFLYPLLQNMTIETMTNKECLRGTSGAEDQQTREDKAQKALRRGFKTIGCRTPNMTMIGAGALYKHSDISPYPLCLLIYLTCYMHQ